VSDKAQTTIRIKWVRSGIGFSYHQKRIVRSLGLRKLNQEVDRPDTPQIRGLVAKVPHLVKIVEPASKPAWMSVPEYTIYPPKEALEPTEAGLEASAIEPENAAAPGDATAAPPHPSDEGPSAGAQAVAQAPSEAPGAVLMTTSSESADSHEAEHAGTGEAAAGIPEVATRTGESVSPDGEERPKSSEAASSEEEKPQV
jgi:large subunit ribosomal protein L30